ncbi:MAG TPA: hypothetical protein PKD00_01875 [Burkholderiales bacterium]|nr:hypothetical protein [Burkholderiales bacterium]
MTPTEWSTIILAIISAMSALLLAVIKFGSDYILKKIEIKEAEKHEKHLKDNLSHLHEDISNNVEIDSICLTIKEHVNCSKCNIWMFHNGGYYYTGNSIQRISMVAGISEDVNDILKHRMTNLPIGVFSRNLAKLLDSDYTHEKNELMYQDSLAMMNLQYQIVSSALFKIKSADEQDWVGILAIGWTEHKVLTETEVSFIKSKLDNITILLSPKLLS